MSDTSKSGKTIVLSAEAVTLLGQAAAMRGRLMRSVGFQPSEDEACNKMTVDDLIKWLAENFTQVMAELVDRDRRIDLRYDRTGFSATVVVDPVGLEFPLFPDGIMLTDGLV